MGKTKIPKLTQKDIDKLVSGLNGGVVRLRPSFIDEEPHDKSVLSIADSLVSGERAATHGNFEDNAFRALAMFGAYRGRNIAMAELTTPQDVALFMVFLKLARESCSHNRDNLIDAAGYIKLFDQANGGV